MLVNLLFFMLITQVPLATTQKSGTITGVVRDGAGAAIGGMRVGAMARPDSLEEAGRGTSMLSIAETDAEGRFTLEEVPPGPYYIAAGRLDRQTFYPGTLNIEEATVITVPPGGTISGLELTVSTTSIGRAPEEMLSLPVRTEIPLQVLVADGDKLPVAHAGRNVVVNLEPTGGVPMPFSVTAKSLTVPGPITSDYRVTVENLPENYAVTSIVYGSTDVLSGTFRLTPQNFPRWAGPATVSVANPALGIEQNRQNFLNALGVSAASGLPATPPSAITVTLARRPKAGDSGVRVTGRIETVVGRLAFLDGRPGTLFSDRTVEFIGVTPGLHSVVVVVAGLRPPFQAASIVVGDRDAEIARFEEVPVLPSDVQIPAPPRPIGSHSIGSTVPLARLRGTLLEETSREPIAEGLVLIKNDTQQAIYKVDAGGRFELPALLPGSYVLEVQAFGHVSANRTVEIGDTDLLVELVAKRVY